MSVLLNAAVIHAGEIVVDDVLDVLDVNAAGRNASGHENGICSGTEGTHGSLTLELGAVGMDRGARVPHVEEEAVNVVGGALRVDEDDGAAGREAGEGLCELCKLRLRGDLDDPLKDVCVRASDAADIDL